MPRADYEEYDKLPGIVMELKHINTGESEKNSPEKINALLQKEAETALRQIEEKSYITELKKSGIQHIAKYGVACCGKHVKVIRKNEQ